jgi:hypothetical protein
MAQLTPYAGNIFQIHGMTESITLFKNGLAHSTETSSNPELPEFFKQILEKGWTQ